MTALVSAESWVPLEAYKPAPGRLNAKWLGAHSGAALATDYQGRRHVLLAIPRIEEGLSDSRSRGLLVTPRMLEIDGAPVAPFIDMCCLDASGRDAFNLVATDLLNRLSEGAAPVDALKATLARWRRFWSAAEGEGLSAEGIRGLFGELYFLLVWLLPMDLGLIQAWVGPAGARNDFQTDSVSIEAKTTASVRGRVHTINGIDQLDPPDHGNLLLYSLRIREEPASVNSLVTLVDGITKELVGSDDLLTEFEAQLALAHYSPLHTDRYREVRFRVVDERVYTVEKDFPRLTARLLANGVPPGVERVDYEINLDTFQHLLVADRPSQLASYLVSGPR